MDTNQNIFEEFSVPDPIRIQKSLKLIKKHFPVVKDLRVLECGIAEGGVSDFLKTEGARCFGIDIHRRQIPEVELVVRDLNDGFPEFQEKFDVIFAGELIEHMYDDTQFVREAKKNLRSGGLLVLTTPNLAFSANRLRLIFGKTPLFSYAPYHYQIYTMDTLKKLLENEGFIITDFTSSHVLFSSRRHPTGKFFEFLGDIFPSMGAHLIICAKNP